MSADLEAQLEEMGADYRALVGRLRAARTVSPRPTPPFAAPGSRRPAGMFRRVGLLTAATLFLAVCVALVIERRPAAADPGTIYTIAYAPTEAALSALVSAQRADGSWENDFVTCQNAAALRRGQDESARIAYRKAVRYLRSKGLSPLSDEQLRERAERAERDGAGRGRI